MLDVRRMRVLREVAAKGSFSAAAESLSYTQSAISQQIAALEREAGTTLVERGARGVRLTDAGRALVEHADVILARLADAEAELDAIAGLRAGRVRLVAFPSAGATIIPPAIARFRAAHPDVDLALRPGEPEDGHRAGARGRGGRGARHRDAHARPRPCPTACSIEPLLDDHMYAVLPAGHRLAGRRRVRLEDLADDPWIIGSSSGTCPDARIVLQACGGAGFEPQIVLPERRLPGDPGLHRRRRRRVADSRARAADGARGRRRAAADRAGAVPADRRGDARRRLGLAGQAADDRGAAARWARSSPAAAATLRAGGLKNDRGPAVAGPVQCAEEDSNLHPVIPD